MPRRRILDDDEDEFEYHDCLNPRCLDGRVREERMHPTGLCDVCCPPLGAGCEICWGDEDDDDF